MKSFVVFGLCCVLAMNLIVDLHAAPPQIVPVVAQDAQVVHYHSDVQPEGYEFQ